MLIQDICDLANDGEMGAAVVGRMVGLVLLENDDIVDRIRTLLNLYSISFLGFLVRQLVGR